MTISLDSTFQSALLKKIYWTLDSVSDVLSALMSHLPDSRQDWEKGDENWARIIKDGEVVAIINTVVPVLAILPILKELAEELAAFENCELILADSFSDEFFSVEKTLLEQIMDRTLSDNVNYSNLSLDDLWWATI